MNDREQLYEKLLEATTPLTVAVSMASLLGDTELANALNNIVIMLFKEALRMDRA
jgi:hypothetical protein